MRREEVEFILPGKAEVNWQKLLDTNLPEGFLEIGTTHPSGSKLPLQGRSFCLFKQSVGSDEEIKSGLDGNKEPAATPPQPKPAKEKAAGKKNPPLEKPKS